MSDQDEALKAIMAKFDTLGCVMSPGARGEDEMSPETVVVIAMLGLCAGLIILANSYRR